MSNESKENCQICLEKFKIATTIKLECKCTYHTDCIYRWYSTKPICPQCETEIKIKIEPVNDHPINKLELMTKDEAAKFEHLYTNGHKTQQVVIDFFNNVKSEILEDCSVCLEPIELDVAFLTCYHVFHKTCVDKWRRIENKCPMCKLDFSKKLMI